MIKTREPPSPTPRARTRAQPTAPTARPSRRRHRMLGLNVEPTHQLEGLELRSVASAALRYYACAFIVLTVGVVLVWFGASMLGAVGRVEEFMRSIGFRKFHFAGLEVIMGGTLLAVAGVAFLTVMTVLAAAFYNLLGRLDHGVGLRIAPISPTVVGELPQPYAPNGNGNGDGHGHADGHGDGNGHGNGNGHASGNGNGHDGAGNRRERPPTRVSVTRQRTQEDAGG